MNYKGYTTRVAQNAATIALRFTELMEDGIIEDWDTLSAGPGWDGEIGVTDVISNLAVEFEKQFDPESDEYYDQIDTFAKEMLIRKFGGENTIEVKLILSTQDIADLVKVTKGNICLSDEGEVAYMVMGSFRSGINMLKKVKP